MKLRDKDSVKINIGGRIYINRKSTDEPMTCPYSNEPCTHHCPLLRELYDEEVGNGYIQLCNGYTLQIIGDER